MIILGKWETIINDMKVDFQDLFSFFIFGLWYLYWWLTNLSSPRELIQRFVDWLFNEETIFFLKWIDQKGLTSDWT